MSFNSIATKHDHRLVPLPAAGHDLGLLIARLLLGSILMAHGWQKLVTNGYSMTSAGFDKMGVPAHGLSAAFAILAELGGGALILVGLATQLAGLLVVVDMAGAYLFVHRTHGLFVQTRGWELVALIGVGAFLFTVVGPGRFSLDSLLTRRRRHAAVVQEDSRVHV